MSYYFTTQLKIPFDEAVALTTERLKEKGFGIITEIDVQTTLKKKLDIAFRPYHILGACNPNFAHQALLVEDKIGLMLPCNVIIQQLDDESVEIAAVDPIASMQAVINKDLHAIAYQVRDLLRQAIYSITPTQEVNCCDEK